MIAEADIDKSGTIEFEGKLCNTPFHFSKIEDSKLKRKTSDDSDSDSIDVSF